MNITTIRLKKDTKKKLREFEIHPRETDEEIILRLIEKCNKKRKKLLLD